LWFSFLKAWAALIRVMASRFQYTTGQARADFELYKGLGFCSA
jgi:hypothetical protein